MIFKIKVNLLKDLCDIPPPLLINQLPIYIFTPKKSPMYRYVCIRQVVDN